MLRVLFSLLCLAGATHARSLCDLTEDDGIVCQCRDTAAICEPTRPLRSLVPAADKLPYENAKRRRDARTITSLVLQSMNNVSFLQTFPKDIFEEPLHLKNVNIAYADLSVLMSQTVYGSDFLKELTLSLCGIKDLQRKAIVGLANLLKLDLSNNEMEVFRTGVLSALPQLEQLIIEHSNIKDVEPHAFVELRSLKHLSLKDNLLTDVDNQLFTGLNNLEKLDLGLNMIEKIDDKTFMDLPKLTHVDLSSNQLMTITPKTFKGMHSLTYLSLHFNGVGKLPDGFLQDSRNLKYLDLSRNQLETVTLDQLHGLRIIRPDFILDLTMNRLNCSCDLYFLKELRKRRLGGMENEFKDPPEFCNLQCRVFVHDSFEPRLLNNEVLDENNCQEDVGLAQHIGPSAISSPASESLQPLFAATIASLILLRLV